MTVRVSILFLVAALLVAPMLAKDKNKSMLPAYVFEARTVLVVVEPDAGEPLEQPYANATARENVEKALIQWGRFDVPLDGQEADLVITVRTGNGKAVHPTIKGGPIDRRAGVGQSTDSTVRIGIQQGQAPPLNDPGMTPPNQGPHVSNEVGASEDTFAVYRGRVQYPLDSPPVWRYVAKDCLRAPTVSAVEEFRKAIAEAEKPHQPKKP
jgi:hypothetical protein